MLQGKVYKKVSFHKVNAKIPILRREDEELFSGMNLYLANRF